MIKAINIQHRIVVLDDGQALPIAQLWDGQGQRTSDPDEALAFVAGTDNFGYISGQIDQFPVLTIH